MPSNYPLPAGTKEIDVRIRKAGRPIEELIGVFQGKIPSNVQMSYIKKIVLKDLQMYINAHRQRPMEEHTMYGKKEGFRYTLRNNLYNAIEASTEIIKESGNRYILGIGEKRFLDRYARYWKVVNYGGYIPPATIGFFGTGHPPISGSNGEVLHNKPYWRGTNPYQRGKNGKPGTGNSFLIIPKRPITPLYYINRMVEVFKIELQLLHEQLKKQTAQVSQSRYVSFPGGGGRYITE